MFDFINNLYKSFFTPQTCLSCGKLFSGYICKDCAKKLNRIKDNICNYCGSVFPDCDKNEKPCPFCKNKSFYFYKLRTFGRYEGLLKRFITSFKYKKIYSVSSELSSFLKEVFLRYFADEHIDFIETVPEFSSNQENFKNTAGADIKEKNHMYILATAFSRLMGIPFADNVIKIKNTLRQQLLRRNERMHNLKGAFKVKNTLLYYRKNILVIDDVLTTGSTINEVSYAIKRSQADKIFVITLARASL